MKLTRYITHTPTRNIPHCNHPHAHTRLYHMTENTSTAGQSTLDQIATLRKGHAAHMERIVRAHTAEIDARRGVMRSLETRLAKELRKMEDLQGRVDEERRTKDDLEVEFKKRSEYVPTRSDMAEVSGARGAAMGGVQQKALRVAPEAPPGEEGGERMCVCVLVRVRMRGGARIVL